MADIAACPTCGQLPVPPLRRDLYVDEAEALLPVSSPERIAAQLGRTPAAVARGLYRAGRADLARPFDAARRRARA